MADTIENRQGMLQVAALGVEDELDKWKRAGTCRNESYQGPYISIELYHTLAQDYAGKLLPDSVMIVMYSAQSFRNFARAAEDKRCSKLARELYDIILERFLDTPYRQYRIDAVDGLARVGMR